MKALCHVGAHEVKLLKALRVPFDDSSFVQHSPKCWMLQSYILTHIISELRISLLLSRMIALINLMSFHGLGISRKITLEFH